MNAKHEQVTAHTAESHSQKWRAMGNPRQASEALQLAALIRELEKFNRELKSIVEDYMIDHAFESNVGQCKCKNCDTARALLTPAKPEPK
ncbi:MAG: hypothetical protein EHM33_00860 [Chloroflexi bacterium]|nr:MAG: hypothetical protein EHM33_00860 [Chloroflexota bacterium]